MRHDDAGATEQQLRREVEELKRQLGLRARAQAGVPPIRWRPSGTTISALLLGFLVLLAGAFIAGYLPLQKREATLRAEAQAEGKALPHLDVMRVVRAAADQNEIKLPGTMQALTEAPILARADGYLKRRLADIGDRVQAGQVVAEIDAPELDQQIHQAEAAVEQGQAATEQAEASLEQGKANRELARITSQRWKILAERGISSQQDTDQYQAQLAAQDANVHALEKAVAAQRSNVSAARANLARLQQVQGYRVVRAPFDGVITLRNVDVGALVSTGNTLLYRIAQTRTLRTYVNVPQASANSVHVGQAATLTVSNFPGRSFRGSVTRTAKALDPASRTMLVEIGVPNTDGALIPGTYAEVDLSGSHANPPLVVPAAAIIFRTDGAQVAVVQPDATVHLQKVAIGRDYGDRVEILHGLADGATIVMVPGDAAREGAKIVPVTRDTGQQ
jgi:RND family efflux transporter MFP subunit